MSWTILSVAIHYEQDTVVARQRARQIAKLLGFDPQEQTRISTAVSEIARNAFNYAGGGRVEYILEGTTSPQLFLIKVTDSGPGIAALDEILSGRYQSRTGMGMGILGARRLMDQFRIESQPGRGTTIWLKKLLPRRAAVVREAELAKLVQALAADRPKDAFEELRHQNQELVAALDEIRTRQSELTRLNRELEDTNRGVVALYAELDEKADHLRRADELKSRFLSNMSHEFRSPLNSILALSALLINRSDGLLNVEQNQQVVFIRKAAGDLLELVNDLLDLAKVEAGKVEVRPVVFQAKNLFAALRGMLRPLLLNQSVDLVFDDVDHLPTMFSDEGKISQILRNFISNALKFTERGEVRVSASLAPDGMAVFSVTDTGIGIAPNDLDLIFRDFAQVDHPIQRRVKGTGLGLPLSKKLAELLGGEVMVQSQLGLGSTFSVRVPARYETGFEQQVPDTVAAPPDAIGAPVLIVEDSPEMMIMYRSYLSGSGFRVVAASTTRQASEMIDRDRPCAIILDILLRSEDSWVFLANLKDDPGTRGIPVLIASTVDDRAKAHHLGADEYLLKPFSREDLLRRLVALASVPQVARVLIIDDQERDRYLLKQQLRNSGMLIEEASSGEAGIRHAGLHAPHVIILDVTMPDMTGFEVLDRLQSDPTTKDIPVLICTSRVLTDSERLQLSGKAAAVLNKENLAAIDVMETIRQAINGGRLAAAGS